MAYDHGGIETLKPKPSGGRNRENMTLEEGKALLARFANAAGEVPSVGAGQPGVLIVRTSVLKKRALR